MAFLAGKFHEIECRILVQGVLSGGPATKYTAWLDVPFLF